MTSSSGRTVGEGFTPEENDLLDILCGGNDPQSAIARAQLAAAAWAGYEFADCECFLVEVPHNAGIARIEHQGGPFAVAEVSDNGESLGFVELWVSDGRLHSVNYMPFSDDHAALPSRHDYEIAL